MPSKWLALLRTLWCFALTQGRYQRLNTLLYEELERQHRLRHWLASVSSACGAQAEFACPRVADALLLYAASGWRDGYDLASKLNEANSVPFVSFTFVGSSTPVRSLREGLARVRLRLLPPWPLDILVTSKAAALQCLFQFSLSLFLCIQHLRRVWIDSKRGEQHVRTQPATTSDNAQTEALLLEPSLWK